MSRYRGPRLKIMRALGVDLPGLGRRTTERRPHPPGQHGPGKTKRNPSVYAIQLREKQKIRFNYGLTERQFQNLITSAFRMRTGIPGDNILSLLEGRLDNVVFRCGFVPTIPAARQLVSHGHVLVDGKKVTVGSYRIRAGQTITLSAKAQNMPVVVSTLEQPALVCPDWLQVEAAQKQAKVVAAPNKDFVPFPVNINQVVEYYSRRIG